MNFKKFVLFTSLLLSSIYGFSQAKITSMNKDTLITISKSDEEWKKLLTPLQYNVARQKGTEHPFSGEYDRFFESGYYVCVCCDSKLFESDYKYNSGCGWPAFSKAANNKTIREELDTKHGMVRTEVLCSKCNAHLGHVFNDGPPPDYKRYCINSVSLKFFSVKK